MAKKTKRATAWSYSQWKAFDTCPLKIGYRRAGFREPTSSAMSRGNRIHKDAELFLLGEQAKIPATLANFKSQLTGLRKKKPSAEEEVAVTDKWERVDWMDKRAWLRYKVDARVDGSRKTEVIDFKTGRIYEDHKDQLRLYAMAEMKIRGATRVIGEGWYFDQDQIIEWCDVNRDDLDDLEDVWNERAEELLTTTEFEAKPGKHCGWCGFNPKKGGPCEFAQE